MLQDQIFKANDIRGVTSGDSPEWDTAGATALGVAYARLMKGTDDGPVEFVVGRDMRTSGPDFSAAFITGARSEGARVVVAGLTSTDELWFVSGHLDLPGITFTASHNPARYNGVKFCLAGARPVTPEFLLQLKHDAQSLDAAGLDMAAIATAAQTGGSVREQDFLAEYAAHLHSLVKLDDIRRLKVVVDAGNGMAGHTAPSVLGPLNLDLDVLYGDLDGTFPNHQPNPLIPENLVDAQRRVVETGADLALVFDGDADRCFAIDETGAVVDPSAITAMIAEQELAREPGATIVINTITSASVPEIVAENGGTTVTSKVGHTYVKALMAEHDAIFGGEHSAHYYFRDFYFADTGMLAGLHVLSLLGHADRPLSQLVAKYVRRVGSGEINSDVDDQQESMDVVAEAFDGRGAQDRIDGLTVRGDGWRVNLRPSNTEPLLRLNVEAADRATMESLRDEVLGLVRG
ncbi:phosphomannomutase/phosphoglucomutase [Raineyella sp. LH-20]|uniref:phosphomannomutase/phosphoglucomutase n=1 Tax=Raineyella sp. LH-20 TaxID=3081204 RepID=UPI0029557ABD|nr:phosphomannomutase/phosphoglucomutase [Raineyella sp. LH-20]WOP18713.1 phosphomannomutase/phosphoglucomutase [Raineyella sp. LH-20]